MNKQILAAFTILLFALAITGYAYTHWQETLQIQGTAQIAKLEIIIQDCQTLLDITYQDSRKLNLTGTITLNQPILTNITIKNTGTTPTTITHSITTNNTDLWQQYFIYSQNITDNYELLPGNTVVAQQNITLTENNPPTSAIEVTVTYTAAFASWTDTITITYILTYQEGGS
ncbi:MAG: hypothetical protein QXK47_03090 [Candidatus Bathyarchaeia archaeon]